MRTSLIVLVGLLLGVTPVAAGDLALDWTSSAARVSYGHTTRGGGLHLEGGWLHDEDFGDAAHAGLHVVGNAWSKGSSQLRAGLGGRVYWIDADFDDGVAVGIGGFASYRFPDTRFRAETRLYFAPDTLTADGIDDLVEGVIRFAVEVVPRAELYFGYRVIELDFDTGVSVDMDDQIHVGLNLRF